MLAVALLALLRPASPIGVHPGVYERRLLRSVNFKGGRKKERRSRRGSPKEIPSRSTESR